MTDPLKERIEQILEGKYGPFDSPPPESKKVDDLLDLISQEVEKARKERVSDFCRLALPHLAHWLWNKYADDNAGTTAKDILAYIEAKERTQQCTCLGSATPRKGCPVHSAVPGCTCVGDKKTDPDCPIHGTQQQRGERK